MAIPNLYQSFWEKLLEKDSEQPFLASKFIPVSLGKLEKIQNSRFWPIQICSSLFRRNCWKNLEWPFLAILNLYQSFWEKLLEKNQNSHFWPFQIYTSHFGKNCWEKIENSHFWPFQIYTNLFGKNCWKKIQNILAKFIPVFLGKLLEKLLEKFGMAIFGHFEFIPVFLGKIVGKKSEQPFWPFQIYTSLFGKNCQKKFGRAIFHHSKFIAVFLGTLLEKIEDIHFWPFQIYTSLFGKNCWKKIETRHFWPFQIYTSSSLYSSGKNCSKKFGTAIFGHSKFIPVCLGKIVEKNLEQPFLAIPNL